MPETNKTRRERARSNALDEGFYAELLHIAGLRETIANGKPAIARLPAHQRADGSLVENALARIAERDGDAPSEAVQQARFDTVLQLGIAWISRLVFLKVLEARLLVLHDGDPAYAFLRADRVRSFYELDALSSEVLGETYAKAHAGRPARFPLIPRFDGSPFVGFAPPGERGPGVPLGALADGPPLPLFARSRLADDKGIRTPVGYLLDFLDAFDFSAQAPRSTTAAKPRVDAATLGLIFERLNGYRDGAWFTPGRVAMHLCKAAIESAVVRRFNELNGWHSETLDQLSELIEEYGEDRDEARQIVDSLRVCDPAVGSGHLLVSSLNERVALKSRLRLLTDIDDEPLDAYRFEVEADRLVVKRYDGGPLQSVDGSEERRRLNKVLFREKHAIVKHGLYGVDLNPLAVKLTQVRLWIELLEHAGYDRDGRFVQLPDLDSTIRQGNAAVSLVGTSGAIDEDAFDWRVEFPDMLDNRGAFRGFDVVVANPPYIDSESMTRAGQQRLRERLSQHWPSAKGNWDLYVVFMELGFALLAPAGAMAYLTPDKWLSKPFGDAFRARHLGKIERIVTLGHDVFKEARVDSIVTVYAKTDMPNLATARMEGDAVVPLACAAKAELSAPWRLDALLSPHYAFVRQLEHAHATLGTLVRCENACATADAYRLKPLVEEARGHYAAQHHFRVVNTGTLAPFTTRWGRKAMTYLGDQYLEPIVDRARFEAEFVNAYHAKAGAKKVIVKGLTRLDAALDLRGDTIPGKTTLILRADDEALLKFAAAVLNCPLAAFYLRARYPCATYNGGIAFTKAMIDSVPVPGNAHVRAEVVARVDALLSRGHEHCRENTEALTHEINCQLYAAFGLSEAEIALVEGKALQAEKSAAKNDPTQNEKCVTAASFHPSGTPQTRWPITN
jgi:hypothetical protein